MIPAAIYARYSTDDQDPRSIEDQVRRCREHAQRHGYTVDDAHIYADEAQSGSTIVGRAGLQRMLAAGTGRRPPFRAVIVDDVSRLSRSMGDFWRIYDDLTGANVLIVDVQTGIDSSHPRARALFGIKSLVADQFLQNVKYQTHRGLQGRALAGFSTGAVIYGYRSVPEPSPADPEHPRRVLVIDEDEAAIVRRIFAEFSDGRSLKGIAAQLNAEGVPATVDRTSRAARGWSTAAVRAALASEKYIGRWVWNRTRNTGKRHVPRPESEHVIMERPDLAIVDRATWDRVQSRLAARKPGETDRNPDRVHLVTGLLRCGTCGGSMSVTGTRVIGTTRHASYQCTTSRKRGATACANTSAVAERRITRALLDAIRGILAGPEIADAFADAFAAEVRALAERPAAGDLEGRLRKAEAERASVTGLLVKRPDSETLLERFDLAEAAVRQLRGEVAAARRASGVPRVPPTREQVRGAISSWLDALGEAEPEAGNALLQRALGHHGITLTPTRLAWEGSGALRVGGILAGSLDARADRSWRWHRPPFLIRWLTDERAGPPRGARARELIRHRSRCPKFRPVTPPAMSPRVTA